MFTELIDKFMDRMQQMSNWMHHWLHATPKRERILATIVMCENYGRTIILVGIGIIIITSELSFLHVLMCLGFIFTLMVESLLKMDLANDLYKASVNG